MIYNFAITALKYVKPSCPENQSRLFQTSFMTAKFILLLLVKHKSWIIMYCKLAQHSMVHNTRSIVLNKSFSTDCSIRHNKQDRDRLEIQYRPNNAWTKCMKIDKKYENLKQFAFWGGQARSQQTIRYAAIEIISLEATTE